MEPPLGKLVKRHRCGLGLLEADRTPEPLVVPLLRALLSAENGGNPHDFWGVYKEPNLPPIYGSDHNGGLYVFRGPEPACAPDADCIDLVTLVNPGSNPQQQSLLRYTNKAATATGIEIQAFDDDGFAAPGGTVETTLAPFASLQLTAQWHSSTGYRHHVQPLSE